MGDNVYGDTLNMTALDSIYARQNRRPGHRTLRESTRVIGTWDDHDHGANDAGRSYPKRDRSQAHVLDFMDVGSPPPGAGGRLQRPHLRPAREARKGDPARHALPPRSDHARPDQRPALLSQRGGDILGEAQWEWLKRELRTSTAQVHLIGTSI